MVPQLLFKWQIIELAPKSKLSVDFFLGDAEVLHIEEANMLGSVGKLLGQLLFALRRVKQA